MGRKRDSAVQTEIAELRKELAAVRAEHIAQIQQQVALVQEIRAEQVAVAQDLHNRQTAQIEALLGRVDASHAQLLAAARASAEDEPRARQTLRALRASSAYEAAFTTPEPLVSIIMPTYTNVTGLRERSIPSVLAQTYANVELVIVGDVAPPETAEVVASFGDDRVRYENLTVRGPYSEHPRDFWYHAGVYALNRGLHASRGQWIAILNDDDAFRPDFVEKLLDHARATRSEVAYGKLRHREPEKDDWDLGVFPPQNHAFGWQMALQHGSLRCFDYEIWAPVFDEPGDWNRAFRMMRAGVTFSMIDEVVADYWPSTLWKDRT